MHYAISDIHGCFKEFQMLLAQIGFSGNDELYVVGDCLDRGPDCVDVLKYMSLHDNIFPIMGNHEYMFGLSAPGLFTEITDDSISQVLSRDFLGNYETWRRNGGETTLNELRRLDAEEREFYMDYISDFPLYETLNLEGRDYLLIHSLPDGYDGKGELAYAVEEILFGRPDFFAKWKQKTIFITGHTPTVKLGPMYAGKIFHRGNFYDIDCGCVTGYRLGVLCLETGEEYYMNSLGTYWTGKLKR